MLYDTTTARQTQLDARLDAAKAERRAAWEQLKAARKATDAAFPNDTDYSAAYETFRPSAAFRRMLARHRFARLVM